MARQMKYMIPYQMRHSKHQQTQISIYSLAWNKLASLEATLDETMPS